MNKSTHTPGPWKVHSDRLGLENVVWSVTEDYGYLAEVNRGKPGWRANAALIAAAPDLLAAAKAVVEYCDFIKIEELDTLRAAIAKAEAAP